jgi:hypothetical protein
MSYTLLCDMFNGSIFNKNNIGLSSWIYKLGVELVSHHPLYLFRSIKLLKVASMMLCYVGQNNLTHSTPVLLMNTMHYGPLIITTMRVHNINLFNPFNN